MQIQTIEQKTGLDRATIRYYEQEGLVCPQRLQNGYRDYSEQHLQDLLKIKLLRQVGLSLETIQQLMEGKSDLRSVLGNQLATLEMHKNHLENAEFICKMILDDNVTYQTIKPNKYFLTIEKKNQTQNNYIEEPQTEYYYHEVHPVRRFVGRYLDQLLTSALLMLIVVVFLRVRPFGDFQNNIISVAAIFLTMPINALFLSLLGTTPGKFVVGIYLKTPEGKNMPFLYALRREWAVFRHGMGFRIPIYDLIRLYKSYQIHTEGRELEWDYDYNADEYYTEWNTKRGVFCAIFAIICALTIGCSAVDAQLPKYRNADLTLAQFAENYNIYAKQNNMAYYLSEEGEWYRPETQNNVILFDNLNFEENWKFITDDNQKLEKIEIEILTDSRLYFTSNDKSSRIIFTAILSQPDPDILIADEAMLKLSELTLLRELNKTQFDFDGVIVNWELKELEGKTETLYKMLVEILLP